MLYGACELGTQLGSSDKKPKSPTKRPEIPIKFLKNSPAENFQYVLALKLYQHIYNSIFMDSPVHLVHQLFSDIIFKIRGYMRLL